MNKTLAKCNQIQIPEEYKDLPDEVFNQLKIPSKENSVNRKIIKLFDNSEEPLAINDIVVGLYKIEGIAVSRRQVMSTLQYLANNNFIKHVERGVYSKK